MLIGNSKLAVGVNMNTKGCLSVCVIVVRQAGDPCSHPMAPGKGSSFTMTLKWISDNKQIVFPPFMKFDISMGA